MSGDHESPPSETTRTGTPRQKLPDASPPALPSQQERRERNNAARYAGVGLQFAIALLVGLAAGSWADRKFGTSYFVLVGVFVGAGAAFYSMYRQLMGNLERDESAKRAQQRAATSSSPAEPTESRPSDHNRGPRKARNGE